MSTLLADPPAATAPEQPPTPESSGAAPAPAPGGAERKCKNCGAAMEGAQEWCLQCGTPAPGSLGAHTPKWRWSALILGATALLVLGAAGAAYAALTKTKVRHVVVVQVPAATATATPPPAATPTTPPAATTPPPAATPKTSVKPPKIPLTASTPSTAAPKATSTPAPASTTPTTTPKTTAPKKSAANNPTAAPPAALLLDTNSVASYNPESYPAGAFGDPTLTVDGDTSTGWTAQVNPAIAPNMAVGLLINLNSAQKLSALQLITSTPGMTVQVFGTAASTAPTAITDAGWTALSSRQLQKERHTLIKLGDSTKAFRMLAVWITGAPPGSIGTAASPGRVSVNEVEVFPAK